MMPWCVVPGRIFVFFKKCSYFNPMLKRYITILVIAIIVVIFAVQNVTQVAIKLWFFDLEASLSLIIILTFTLGAVLTILFSLNEFRKKNKKIGQLETKIADLKEIIALKEKRERSAGFQEDYRGGKEREEDSSSDNRDEAKNNGKSD